MIKNGDLPAMPVPIDSATGAEGLTKREMFAMQFAGRIWAQYQNDGTAAQYDNWREGVCVESVRLADALLAELERTNGL
jgi:hypothetical protein